MIRKCKNCGFKFEPKYSTVQMVCSKKCEIEYKNKQPKKKRERIPVFSTKRKEENSKYIIKRKAFLNKPENKICFIEGCNKPANTVEHLRGRVGYADDWARENNIPLLLDQRYWAGCCLEHNLELENNPELSKKYQLSKIHGGQKI